VIVLPLIAAAVWVAIVRAREAGPPSPLTPTTSVGKLALGSLVLLVLVIATDAAVATSLPSGVVMFGLASLARWVRHDLGLLVVVPLTQGFFAMLLPILFE
jgi:hypothetical protein